MSSAESRAVFISYSSDDVEAAQRIATALLDAGIEVWFDRSELRGGDAWDQNIRRQIKECALFLPIVSQTTERRPEGYFRLEWRLADNRTHHMGRTKSFLVPVCIDASVNQSFADVPDSFLAVHWTLLPGGEPNQGFVDNVKTLLSGNTALDAGRTRPPFPFGSHPPAGTVPPPAPAAPTGRPWLKRLLIGVTVVALLAAAGFVAFVKKAVETAEKSIAVLPFKDNSDPPGSGTSFADGLQQDIIAKLGLIADFKVIPRASVAQYRDNPKPIPEIARDLIVGYFVDGSVTRVGDKAQVAVSLISAGSNTSIWDKTYPPVDLTDRFTVQAAVASSIAEALKTTLSEREKAALAKKPTVNVNAYGIYQDELEAFGRDRITPALLKRQAEKLDSAVEAAPDFAAAWGLLGSVHSLMVSQGFDTSEERIGSARRAIDKAVEIDADSADTLRSQGVFLSAAMRDYPGAIERFQKLQALNLTSGDAAGLLGAVYRHQGKWPEAVASLLSSTSRDASNLTHLRTLEKLQLDGRNFDSARLTRLDILNVFAPGTAGRGGRVGGGRGGPGGPTALADTTIPLLADRPEESYALALIVLHGSGSLKPGDDFFAALDEKLAASPRFIALKTDWLRRTNRLDAAIDLDRKQPAFADDGEPAWRQAIDLAAAYAAKGDMAGARTRLAGVTDELQALLVGEPTNFRLQSWLGLALSLNGERDAALRAGQQAVKLGEGDAVALADSSLRLALIQSWVGDTEAAFTGLTALLAKPGCEATIHSMKLDPWFAKLRGETVRFESLVTPQNHVSLIQDLGGRGGGGRGQPGQIRGGGPGGRGGNPQDFVPGGQNRGNFPPGQIPVRGN